MISVVLRHLNDAHWSTVYFASVLILPNFKFNAATKFCYLPNITKS